jgi:tetratricopeptide (TPR) repeat protein
MRLASLLLLLLAGPALAAPRGPQHPPQPKPLDALFQALKQASSPEDAKPIEDQIGLFFMQSGSPSIDLLMTRGTAAFAGGDKDTARKIFNSVTSIAPDYAEGWHNKAALQITANDNEGAMVSLQRTIMLNPREFKALSELADMLEDYGDKKAALQLYKRALAIDPKLEGIDRHVKALEDEVEGQRI